MLVEITFLNRFIIWLHNCMKLRELENSALLPTALYFTMKERLTHHNKLFSLVHTKKQK